VRRSESPERPDGERPGRQVRAVGNAELFADHNAARTRRITDKHLRGPARQRAARAADDRVVIRLPPTALVGVAGV